MIVIVADLCPPPWGSNVIVKSSLLLGGIEELSPMMRKSGELLLAEQLNDPVPVFFTRKACETSASAVSTNPKSVPAEVLVVGWPSGIAVPSNDPLGRPKTAISGTPPLPA